MDAETPVVVDAATGGILEEAARIWLAGGPAMIAIAVVALLMCGLAVNMWLGMVFDGLRPRKDARVRGWIASPATARGVVPSLIAEAAGGGSAERASLTFAEFRSSELEPFSRQLRLMKVCVGIAPLLGLFGTVTGMLATFAALATGSGGEQTMGAIAKGISEALITTETGLVVALPGLFIQYHLSRKLRGFEVFLDHAESLCRRAAMRAPEVTASARAA
jgi:biopolymer transport protein ExbB